MNKTFSSRSVAASAALTDLFKLTLTLAPNTLRHGGNGTVHLLTTRSVQRARKIMWIGCHGHTSAQPRFLARTQT